MLKQKLKNYLELKKEVLVDFGVIKLFEHTAITDLHLEIQLDWEWFVNEGKLFVLPDEDNYLIDYIYNMCSFSDCVLILEELEYLEDGIRIIILDGQKEVKDVDGKNKTR